LTTEFFHRLIPVRADTGTDEPSTPMDSEIRHRADSDARLGLIVAASPEMREVVGDILQAGHVIAVPADDAAHATVLAQRLHLNLVIIVVDGQDDEPVRTFKRCGSTAPVLALCFEREGDEPHECRARGADAVLCWPFTLADLAPVMRRLLLSRAAPIPRLSTPSPKRDRCAIQ
jgi:DNA-binding response OmpR family regulator